MKRHILQTDAFVARPFKHFRMNVEKLHWSSSKSLLNPSCDAAESADGAFLQLFLSHIFQSLHFSLQYIDKERQANTL